MPVQAMKPTLCVKSLSPALINVTYNWNAASTIPEIAENKTSLEIKFIYNYMPGE